MKLKHFTLFLFLLMVVGIQSNAQTPLWSEDFEGTVKMTLNTTDIVNGTTCSGVDPYNQWIVNSSYTGSNAHISGAEPGCSNTGLQLLVANTPVQPNGQSKYLHVYSPFIASKTSPVCDNANWIYAGSSLIDGCPPPENLFVKMSSGVSTIGKSNVAFKFLWLCNTTNVYGQLYYSTNGGSSWTQAGSNYTLHSSWTQASVSLPAFDGVADLRFGFMWVSPENYLLNFSDNDPPFSIDDLSIEVPGATVNSVTTGTIAGSPFCSDISLINVPFTSAGTYNGGNTFTAQLSDANGSFASPAVLGSGTSSPIQVLGFPVGVTLGTKYRIRVVASSPSTIGSDNGTDIEIKAAPVPNFATSTSGLKMTFTNQSTGATSYNWDFDDNGATSTDPSPIYTFVNTGQHHVCLEVTNNSGCTASRCDYFSVWHLGVNSISAEGIWKIYPSPFGENIFISADKANIREIKSIEIYDLLGRKLIDEQTTFENPLRISTESLKSGVYLLKVKTAGADYFQTVTKL